VLIVEVINHCACIANALALARRLICLALVESTLFFLAVVEHVHYRRDFCLQGAACLVEVSCRVRVNTSLSHLPIRGARAHLVLVARAHCDALNMAAFFRRYALARAGPGHLTLRAWCARAISLDAFTSLA